MICNMSAETKPVGNIPLESTSGCDEVIEHILYRKPLDPNVNRCVRERSGRVTEEIRRCHGFVDIAVKLIRETRGEN